MTQAPEARQGHELAGLLSPRNLHDHFSDVDFNVNDFIRIVCFPGSFPPSFFNSPKLGNENSNSHTEASGSDFVEKLAEIIPAGPVAILSRFTGIPLIEILSFSRSSASAESRIYKRISYSPSRKAGNLTKLLCPGPAQRPSLTAGCQLSPSISSRKSMMIRLE